MSKVEDHTAVDDEIKVFRRQTGPRADTLFFCLACRELQSTSPPLACNLYDFETPPWPSFLDEVKSI